MSDRCVCRGALREIIVFVCLRVCVCVLGKIGELQICCGLSVCV